MFLSFHNMNCGCCFPIESCLCEPIAIRHPGVCSQHSALAKQQVGLLARRSPHTDFGGAAGCWAHTQGWQARAWLSLIVLKSGLVSNKDFATHWVICDHGVSTKSQHAIAGQGPASLLVYCE